MTVKHYNKYPQDIEWGEIANEWAGVAEKIEPLDKGNPIDKGGFPTEHLNGKKTLIHLSSFSNNPNHLTPAIFSFT